MAGAYIVVESGNHRVIALHGWFGSALGWGHLTDYLNTAQFTYVFPDLRGYGSRRDEPGEVTMAEAAGGASRASSEGPRLPPTRWSSRSALSGTGSAWSATR